MHLDLHASEEELAQIAKVERRKDRITNSVVVLVVLALTAGAGYWIYGQHVRAVRLDTQGKRVVGKVEGDEYTEVTRTKTGEVRYEIHYWFNVGAGTYRSSGMVRDRPHAYQDVTVIYDPVDPSNNKLEGENPFSSTWPETIGLLAFAYIVAGIRFLYRKY